MASLPYITAAITACMIWLFPSPELTGLLPRGRGRVMKELHPYVFHTLPARPPAFYVQYGLAISMIPVVAIATIINDLTIIIA